MKVYRESLRVRTAGEFDVIDVTADVEKAVLTAGIEEGYALVYSRHTTFAILLNERESGLLVDAGRLLRGLVPERNGYLHDDFDIRTENLVPDEPPNAHAHLRHMLAGRNSEYVPVAEGALALGTWQRIMLVEFDRPRDREVLVQVCGIPTGAVPADGSGQAAGLGEACPDELPAQGTRGHPHRSATTTNEGLRDDTDTG